jgi:ATPase subunit of ABC transporter with duplicated ATPase domains
MSHKPIQLHSVNLSFPHKTCFDDFSTQIPFASRIAIIGRNGSGKSTLLKMLQGVVEPSSGDIIIPKEVQIAYVPQIIDTKDILSGGERFNAYLWEVMNSNPNVLLLDEPSNHLDMNNRYALMRLLDSFMGTLIMVTHDNELLDNCIHTVWHIEHERIQIFKGRYQDYQRERCAKRVAIEQELDQLKYEKKELHHTLMKEQKRAAKSRTKGKKSIDQSKWPTIVSKAKALNAEKTSGRKTADIQIKKQELNEKLSLLRTPEIILPNFSLIAADLGTRNILTISEGAVGYDRDKPLLNNIRLSLGAGERVAITGNNGCGKSTLIKAILNDLAVFKSGNWYVPKSSDMGYLDQHYKTLEIGKSVFETIRERAPTWSNREVRDFLNHFLFRKHEEIEATIETLSGGEKVRLCLAQIACKTPKLLILDEVTNNLDLETKEHVVQVLKEYPGSMIVISHDQYFLDAIGVVDVYCIEDGMIKATEF